MPAKIPKMPERKPWKNIPQKVVVPKIGERTFKLKYATTPMKKEAERL